MTGLTPLMVVAAIFTSLALGGVAWLVVPPPRRLRSRLYPYLNPSVGVSSSSRRSTVSTIFGPILADLAEGLSRLVDRRGERVTLQKLRQANWYSDLSEPEMFTAFRLRQLKAVTVSIGSAALAVVVLSLGLWPGLALGAMGAVVGVARTRGQLDRAIEDRRERMKIEIYTVNQLLAMRVRAGGGVIQAVAACVKRGRGEVVGELAEALRLHRSGWPGPDAFRRIAELSPEPFCSRTYRLLATAEERGADLAGALLSLSEDVRETRRESVKRTATKRRAAMLVPTIAILAPVLILFVAAPLPYLITSWQ